MSDATSEAKCSKIRKAKMRNLRAALQATLSLFEIRDLEWRSQLQDDDMNQTLLTDEELLEVFAFAIENFLKKMETETLIEVPGCVEVAGVDNYINNDEIQPMDALHEDTFNIPFLRPLSGYLLDMYNAITKSARDGLIETKNSKGEDTRASVRFNLWATVMDSELVLDWMETCYLEPLVVEEMKRAGLR